MERELIEERDGLRLCVAPDPDPPPPDEDGDDVESGVYLTTTRNRYFERHPELLQLGSEIAEWYSFPLFMYAHSGVSLSLSDGGYPYNDPWDAGQVGFVRVRRCEHWPSIGAAMACAEASVEAWNQYLCGDVWGFEIEDPDGEHVDSCWGFYGREECVQEGGTRLVAAVEERAEQAALVEAVWAY